MRLIFTVYRSSRELGVNDDFNIEAVELKGFSRSIAELEWLLLILVILYLVAPGVHSGDSWTILQSCVYFAVFVLLFRYLNFYRRETRWKMAIEIWVMIGFITWVLFHTGGIDSPLLNLYLLVIITSGLTLGKIATMMILALITSIYIYLGYPQYAGAGFSLESFGRIMTTFSPYLLIAYLTTMLAADLHFAKQMFKSLSETDELTSIDNFRAFNNTLELEVKKATRYKQNLSILMIDADGLKAVNDQFGHEGGNRLIKAIANTILGCLRESDSLARYGGDEFIALLPASGEDAALEAADRIRKAVENTSFDMQGQPVRTTVSIGVAGFPDNTQNTDELIRHADEALYRSKRDGRNRVTLWSSLEADKTPPADDSK